MASIKIYQDNQPGINHINAIAMPVNDQATIFADLSARYQGADTLYYRPNQYGRNRSNVFQQSFTHQYPKANDISLLVEDHGQESKKYQVNIELIFRKITCADHE